MTPGILRLFHIPDGVTVKQQALVFLVAVSIAVLATAICYLMLHRKQREKLYTEEIRKSVQKARKANEEKTRFLFKHQS